MSQIVNPHGILTLGEDDLEVTPQQFLAIPLFSDLKNKPTEKHCRGAFVLRIFKEADQIICKEGTAGVSAYFILNEADVYALYAYVETMLETAQAKLQAFQAASNPPEKLKAYVQKLRTIRDSYRARLLFLADAQRTALLKAAHEANEVLAQRCRTSPEERRLLIASAKDKRDHAEMIHETDPVLAPYLLAAAQAQDDRPAAAVCRPAVREKAVPGSSDGDGGSSHLVTMHERELFGEMACKNRKPRAADVRAARPCYVLELLSNVLDTLEKDPRFKKELQETYEQRVLELHLRDFSLFRHLPEERFMAIYGRIRSRLHVRHCKAGETICEEGSAADAVYMIRRGWVQVKVRQGTQQQIIAYRGPGEFIGEMGLIRTAEQTAALEKADFTGVLQTMPEPGPQTATCVAFGHSDTLGRPSGESKVELVAIPYPEFWELIKASPGLREEFVAEVERRRTRSSLLPPVPDVKGDVKLLFAETVAPLGLYEGQSLMLIDLNRCTRCDECVQACVHTHQDGRSRLFLVGPRTEIDNRKFLVPTTCQSCEDPVCMIGCPTRAIRRGDEGQMVINNETCIGCEKCANNCPYNAIQMHDLGLIPGLKPPPGRLHVRGESDKQKETSDKRKEKDNRELPPPIYGWYCYPAKEISEKESAVWRTRTAPPRGWLACTSPFYFGSDFRAGLAAAAQRTGGSAAISPNERLCFWRKFVVSFDRQDWDGQFALKVKSAPDSFKVWIDGREINPGKRDALERTYSDKLRVPASKGWRWWRKDHAHVLAMEVIPKCASGDSLLGDEFLDVRLDAVEPSRRSWDVEEEITAKAGQPKLAVVCDLCHTLSGGPACIRACPHDATLRFDARGGLPRW